jgi:L-rhamnose mutarotase
MKLRPLFKSLFGITVVVVFCTLASCNSIPQKKNLENSNKKLNQEIKRIGMVIKIDSSRIKEYMALHADSTSGIRDLLQKYNMKNFSIFLTKLEDGNYYEFGYYEYAGQNYEADMAALASEPRNIAWLKICDAMQIPLKGESSWKKMPQVFFNK